MQKILRWGPWDAQGMRGRNGRGCYSRGVRWIRQNPVTEDTCGQCCLAMLLSIGKRDAVARVGHDEGTTTAEMARILRAGGLRVGARLRRLRVFDAIPTPRALLLGSWRRYPHWMVWNRGRLHDPIEGIFRVGSEQLPRWLAVTHYLPVE